MSIFFLLWSELSVVESCLLLTFAHSFLLLSTLVRYLHQGPLLVVSVSSEGWNVLKELGKRTESKSLWGSLSIDPFGSSFLKPSTREDSNDEKKPTKIHSSLQSSGPFHSSTHRMIVVPNSDVQQVHSQVSRNPKSFLVVVPEGRDEQAVHLWIARLICKWANAIVTLRPIVDTNTGLSRL